MAAIRKINSARGFWPVVVLPVYNHATAVKGVLNGLLGAGLDIIIVDDGSDDGGSEILRQAAREHTDVRLISHKANEGKGQAVMSGIRAALAYGYSHVLQVDADGQHDLGDVEQFLSAARANPRCLILGNPVFDESVPWERKWGRKISNGLVVLEALTFQARDVLCGYRVYPIRELSRILLQEDYGKRMDFEIDILVRILRVGTQVINIPTRVCYPSDGVSHFSYYRDNLMLVRLHVRLLCEMLILLPRKLFKRISPRSPARRQ